MKTPIADAYRDGQEDAKLGLDILHNDDDLRRAYNGNGAAVLAYRRGARDYHALTQMGYGR